MTHRDYYIRFGLSTEQYGEILVAEAFRGKKTAHGNKGFDIVDAHVAGKKVRIEVKSKLAKTPSGNATVIHCNANKIAQGAMDYLAVVLIDDPKEGNVEAAWLITCAQAANLRRQHTDSKYISVRELRDFSEKRDITEELVAIANKTI